MIVQKHIYFPVKRYVFHLFNGFYNFDVIERDNWKYYLVCACVIMKDILKSVFFFVFEDI